MKYLTDQILRLTEVLKQDLPGKTVQFQMSPVRLEADLYYEESEHAREAAVMALLMPIKSEWHITFIKRPDHPNDKHSGQISFPGGGMEDGDLSFEYCARRETFEEIGIPVNDIHVLGNLTKLYVYASNNLVFPYVGYIENAPKKFKIQTTEVERVITAPMSFFSNPSILKSTSLDVRGYKLENVPYYDLYGEILWGATAMMMIELVNLWNKIK